MNLNRDIEDRMAKDTTDSIELRNNLLNHIDNSIHKNGRKVYITGWRWWNFVSRFIKGSIYDEGLIFKGIERALNGIIIPSK